VTSKPRITAGAFDMPPFLKWAFRPTVLIGISVILVGAAAFIVFQPEPSSGKPRPLAVGPGEQEIVFLYPATNNAAWERFVSAVDHAAGRLRQTFPGLEVVRGTTDTAGTSENAVAEIGLRWPGDASHRSRADRLVFRWYKLTSEWSPQAWIDALLARSPPPLAIIGGNNSYWGRELALQLRDAGTELPEETRPLLLLTTATADKVLEKTGGEFSEAASSIPSSGAMEEDDPRKVDLASLYPGRTYRFCFTNRQMATAITRFIWNRPELRPDADPAYLVQWTDDAYSQDLVEGYQRVLSRRATENLIEYWGYVTGCSGLGVHPALLAGWYTSAFRHDGSVPVRIDYSVGSFASPNPQEANAVSKMLDPPKRHDIRDDFPVPLPSDVTAPPPRRRAGRPRQPLLVVAGQAQASRRFLRELARSAPDLARRFVVATGDAISFNTIYRDRLVTWPIQDLPFHTVFFSHRNPVDPEAGFVPIPVKDGEGAGTDKLPPPRLQDAKAEASRAPDAPEKDRVTSGGNPPPPAVQSTSGTEDLLLFRDVVEALALAFDETGRTGGASDLAKGLHAVHFHDGKLTLEPLGKPLFNRDHPGQRNGGTGEHVIYLRPNFRGNRVLPRAVIEVWSRQPSEDMTNMWIRCREPLTVSYDEF
jgi:hypothetical protein